MDLTRMLTERIAESGHLSIGRETREEKERSFFVLFLFVEFLVEEQKRTKSEEKRKSKGGARSSEEQQAQLEIFVFYFLS